MSLQNAVALAAKIQGISKDVVTRHIQRGDVVKATLLALISGRPAFFLGTPGVDKTGTVEALAGRIDGAVFFEALMPVVASSEQLLVESTSIEEVPMLNGGKSIRTSDTLGRAANAHLIFADEIWKADARVLQTLLDLSKGDGVRHEGKMVKTPTLAFLAASNELADPEGNLGAMWSRMTIRVVVEPLDRSGKIALVKARLNRDRKVGAGAASAKLTLSEIETLRSSRPQVTVPDDIVECVLVIYQALLDEKSADFSWLWADDRRFGRVFDVLQASALLEGRDTVSKKDLAVLSWMLWDSPDQIPTVEGVLAPYCRTPLGEARTVVDELLVAGGHLHAFAGGDMTRASKAMASVNAAKVELGKLVSGAGSDAPTIQKWVGQIGTVSGKVAMGAADPSNRAPWDEITALFA